MIGWIGGKRVVSSIVDHPFFYIILTLTNSGYEYIE